MIQIQPFFDSETFTLTYCVWDPASHDGFVVDPVWNFDQASSTLSERSHQELSSFIHDKKINLHWILETHAHADHISGAQILKKTFPHAKIAIGERIREVQEVFKPIFDLRDLRTDGKQFDKLLKDRETLDAGSLKIKVYFTPGHTPACVSYHIEDAIFTGDALFMPDTGTGRCDFPEGDADALYTSVAETLYSLPDSTRVFTGHDYQAGGRNLKFQSTIEEEKASNIHIKSNTARGDYVAFRKQRDATLAAPKLLLPSIQLNIDGGRLPFPRPDGKLYLTIPLKIKN